MFQLPPPPFGLGQARLCAALIATAYDMAAQWEAQGKPEPSAFAWTPHGLGLRYSEPVWGATTGFFPFFHHQEPFAFVACDSQGLGALVFRGTDTPPDDLDDLLCGQSDYSPVAGYGLVHEGFEAVYASMSAAIRAAVEPLEVKQLLVTGHSMGSALALLSVPDLIHNTRILAEQLLHLNLACPRVASPRFAERYEAEGVPTYRIVNTCDLVTEVPPAVLGDDLYRHVGAPVCFTHNYGSLRGNHSAADSYGRALSEA